MVTELNEIDEMYGYEEINAKMAELPPWQQNIVIRFMDFLLFKQKFSEKIGALKNKFFNL